MLVDARSLRETIRALCAALVLGSGLLPAPAAAYTLERPTLTLEAVGEEDLNLSAATDWRSDRLIEGIGWRIASAVRDPQGGLSAIMRCGYTVILPATKEGRPFRHMYVLGAFDLLPDTQLLVTIRDPEHYWPGYNYQEGVVDPLELVCYSKSWEENYAVRLDFAAGEYPDDFRLNDNQNYLLAITHPQDAASRQTPEGSELKLAYLHDGSVVGIALPEADDSGFLPSEWYPLKMGWDSKGRLLVQTALGFRIYSVEW